LRAASWATILNQEEEIGNVAAGTAQSSYSDGEIEMIFRTEAQAQGVAAETKVARWTILK
jgi:hypothetical protein